MNWQRSRNFSVCDVKPAANLRYCFCYRLQVYPLHSTVTLEEQNGVFLKPVHGFRKVKTWFSSHFYVVFYGVFLPIINRKDVMNQF